jgi:rubrerythrin
MRRRTTEEVKEEVRITTDGEYELIGSYEKASSKTTYRHLKCNTEFSMRPNDFKNGQRCPSCSKKNKRMTSIEFSRKLASIHNGKYKLKSDYEGHDKQVTIWCEVHEIEFTRIASTALRKRDICPRCFGENISKIQRKDTDTFTKQLEKSHGGSIKLLGEYTGTHTKTMFMCQTCGGEFYSEPNALLRVSGCPICAAPKGEQIIMNYLNARGINFVHQKTFDSLADKRSLYYDFFLEDYGILIEYDGEQHYRPIEYFGGEPVFNKQKEHDIIKDEYASLNKLNLVRVPYYLNNSEVQNLLDKTIRKA